MCSVLSYKERPQNAQEAPDLSVVALAHFIMSIGAWPAGVSEGSSRALSGFCHASVIEAANAAHSFEN